MAELRIHLLGGFRVSVDRREVPERAWRRRKPAAVVKLLSLAPGHRLHREQVMEALWPELDPQAASANLRKAVHLARRALAPVDGAGLIASGGELLGLPRGVWVDVDAFRSAVAAARRSGDPAAYAAALELYGDGLLPDDRYEEWAIGPREQLHLELLAVLEEQAGLLEASGDLGGAASVVRRLVAAEPLREESHAWLIRLHALAGRRGEALQQYERLRELLEAELGVEPGAETERLYEEIRARQALDPELSADLWERVGDLRVISGDADGATRAFGKALDAAASSEDAARLQRKTAAGLLFRQRPEEAEKHLGAAERLSRAPDERARLVHLRATQAWQRGDLLAARELAERARELADAHGGPEEVAAAYEVLAVVSHLQGNWREGLQVELERLAGPGSEGPHLARVFDIHHCIGQYHLYGDELADSVEDYARRTLAFAEEAAAARAQAFAWCLLGETLLLQARWDEAAGCLERSCELHASFGTRSGALPWQRLAELAVCRGDYEEARACLRRASAIATVSNMATHLWSRIHATAALAALEQDDPEAGARSVRAAAGAAVRYGSCPTCGALLNPVAAEVFAALGDAEGARASAATAAEVAAVFDSSAWRAMAESAAGSAAAAVGEPEEARARFGAAAELFRRARQPFWEERALAQQAARERSGNGPPLASPVKRRDGKEQR